MPNAGVSNYILPLTSGPMTAYVYNVQKLRGDIMLLKAKRIFVVYAYHILLTFQCS